MTHNKLSFVALAVAVGFGVGACSASETHVSSSFGFDGTCVNCHLGLSGQHTHPNYKLRCIDCHGGNDQIAVGSDATVVATGGDPTAPGKFRDQNLMRQAHNTLAPNDPITLAGSGSMFKNPLLARFFFANGIDDNGDGTIDDFFINSGSGFPTNLGEVWEPELHGDGPGEFVDSEYNRDLNYTRFHNPGDLRVATIGCGSRNRAALEGGGGGACHQETIEVVRRSIMVNQAAVTNGAYYGNESWRPDFFNARDKITAAKDPRAGGLGYQLDYASADSCIDLSFVGSGSSDRGQPRFNTACAEASATNDDPEVAAGASGNEGLPAFEIAQAPLSPPNGNDGSDSLGSIDPGVVSDPATTISQLFGAGQSRYPWGGTMITDTNDPDAARPQIQPIANSEVPGLTGVPDPVDVILRTFRAYYPLNYPGSVVNQNFTFGTSIEPDIDHFKTNDPFGRAHSSGCSACHAAYNYDGTRNPTTVICNGDTDSDPTNLCNGQDTGSAIAVVDPTTKHREFNQATDVPVAADPIDNVQDPASGFILRGRTVNGFQQISTPATASAPAPQANAYSADHVMTTAITTDQCGLCHGFVTRINYAYQGEAEEEQRDQLSRREATNTGQQFTTPQTGTGMGGTKVQILDSWVRANVDPTTKAGTVVNSPSSTAGLAGATPPTPAIQVIQNARARDALLAQFGFVPGNGGCAANTFTEDCNNNGELDPPYTLTQKDANGNVVGTATINEDGMVKINSGSGAGQTAVAGNGNGILDLIDRLPRENSIDGRQMRYVYGDRNGSTRLMDIHFQVGMHCIDCHFLQDVHGDGHIYTTNWDQIEIECEDCHGSTARATLRTSGPNGGNDLTKAHDANDVPYFSNSGGTIIQRSRVTPGLFWVVPQTIDQGDALSQAAHANCGTGSGSPGCSPHLAAPGQGSTFTGMAGMSPLQSATLECATCHSSWIHNCTGCHVNVNIGDQQRLTIDANNNLTKSAHENEIWFNNSNNDGSGGGGHIDFQLLGIMRAPFVLGVSSSSEIGRLTTFRSSMQAMASVTDQNTNEIAENLSFTTFQALDANSGRTNVATSGVAMNQTMAHTVRPHQARGCEMCHSLVNPATSEVRNEHLLAETYGLGTGALDYAGDFAYAVGQSSIVGSGGLELYEYKANNELAQNKAHAATDHSWFPGLIVDGNPLDRNAGNVEPIFAGGGVNVGDVGVDVVLIRNFNATPAMAGAIQAPTLRDLAVTAVVSGATGKLLISDVSGKGTPGVPGLTPSGRLPTTNTAFQLVVPLDGPPTALSHLAPDVSDPFVYVAVGTAGIDIVNMLAAPSTAVGANAVTVTHVQLGESCAIATALIHAGHELYVGTNQGTVEAFNLSDPSTPKPEGGNGNPITVSTGKVNALALEGFVLWGTSATGLFAVDLANPAMPATLAGAGSAEVVTQAGMLNFSVSQGHVYVAEGANGVHDFDARTVTAPVDNGNVVPPGVGSGAIAAFANFDSVDVVVSTMPGQVWLEVLDGTTGKLGMVKLDNHLATRDFCFPDPVSAGCTLDLAFYDATQSGRDPSFDPVQNTFDATDPSSFSFVMANTIIQSGERLARPAQWEAIGTLTGRRYRDSFMPGSGVLSLSVMQQMRSVQVCESTDANSRAPGNLNVLGYPSGATCAEFTPASVPMIRKPTKSPAPRTANKPADKQVEPVKAAGPEHDESAPDATKTAPLAQR